MKHHRIVYLVFILSFVLAACSAAGSATPLPTAGSTPPQTPGAASAVPQATVSPQPSPEPGRVILVASPTADAADAAQIEAARGALSTAATSAGLMLETRPALRAEEISAAVRLVVFLHAPSDLAALTAAAPKTQFLLVGGEQAAGGNLSVIRQAEEQRAFLAGYITTIIAPDWRSLGLLPDAPAQLQDAFINGGRFWCGRCIPIYAPLVLFPLTGAQPAGAAPGAWQSTVQQMQKNVIEAVYLSPAAHSADLLQSLAAQKMILVGTLAPPAEAKSRWAATLTFDSSVAIARLAPDLLAGKGGQSATAALRWTEVNPDLFTVGKQRLAQAVLDGLVKGEIAPLSVPEK